MNYSEAVATALLADEAWSAELRRVFGERAGDARYAKSGEGAPGSRLRRLYEAKINADRDMRELRP
jgi:hypothetical protein